MILGLIALSVGCVTPIAALAVKLRRPAPLLAHYTRMLLPQPPMVRLVQLECARAERNGAPLSMVVFPISTERQKAKIDFLERLLPEKIRLADAAGWISDRELAVLLPETAIGGARNFINLLKKQCGRGHALPEFDIYRFDGKWVPESEQPVVRPAEPQTLALSA